MRKLFIVMLLLVSSIAGAQTVKSAKSAKPFKVNLAGGYAQPIDRIGDSGFIKPGFVYSVEPQYTIIKHLDVGVRFEQAFIKRAEFLDKDIYYSSKAKSILSAAVTANYVLPVGGRLRPYLGVGAGLYYTDKSEQAYQSGSSTVSYPLPATTAFGGLARAGVKFGILNVEANYNAVSDVTVTNAATRLTLTAKNSYFSVKAGITIGGSR